MLPIILAVRWATPSMAPISSKYISLSTFDEALHRLYGTADHLLKIWFTLKQMGMAESNPPVIVTTASPNEALIRLFAFGSPEGELFVPFAHTSRFMKMKGDAARSIVQTTIQRWKSSGSVVTCDPTGFLDIQLNAEGQLTVRPMRSYPLGLGFGMNGFALEEGKRVTIPSTSFAAWYYRQTALPSDLEGERLEQFIVSQLCKELNITQAEFNAVFVEDNLKLKTDSTCLSDRDIYQSCNRFLSDPGQPITTILAEDFSQHSLRIRSMKTINDKPQWLNRPPTSVLEQVVKHGDKAVLLCGPPRTGKTRAIDMLYPRNATTRTTIQIHDGWGYDNLIQGFRPDHSGKWSWESGPLKRSIEGQKKVIVLEEINRTNLTQALGEVFSLIEDAYRGAKNQIMLRSGEPFFIPEDVLIMMTMNTIDKSTEDIDDAMIGRFSVIEFPPRIEDAADILTEHGITNKISQGFLDLFAFIQEYYPLGQGYFAAIRKDSDPLSYYTTRIRPVLANHFRDFKPENLDLIDNKADTLFTK